MRTYTHFSNLNSSPRLHKPHKMATMTDEEIKQWRIRLQGFTKALNAEPNKDEVRVNQHAANTLYLPISYVEMSLDELFFGLWETKDFRWRNYANEIVGTITLRVFHPVANQWIERTGASATMIRQQRGAGITELEKKIHNALEMDFPHLKADCIVNAAKSLGKMFGRDLNRKFADVYRPLITGQAIKAGAVTAQVEHETALSKALFNANTLLEQANMDDQTLQSISVALSNCETPQDVSVIIEDIKMYLPTTDPAKQFGERENAMNGTQKRVSRPTT